MGSRLKAARVGAGFRSKLSASQHFGWRDSSYRAHEAGERTIGQDDAEKYGRAFGVSAQWIMFGDDETGPSAESQLEATIPVAGTTGHDRLGTILPAAEGRTVTVDLPIDPTQGWEAIAVDDEHLDPWLKRGSFLVYRRVLESDFSMLADHECVIKLVDGRRYVRRLQPDSKHPGRWLLESDFVIPLENQELRWAAPIRFIWIWHRHPNLAA